MHAMSDAIRDTQRHSAAITRLMAHPLAYEEDHGSEAIRGHQRPSEAIRGNQTRLMAHPLAYIEDHRTA